VQVPPAVRRVGGCATAREQRGRHPVSRPGLLAGERHVGCRSKIQMSYNGPRACQADVSASRGLWHGGWRSTINQAPYTRKTSRSSPTAEAGTVEI
jgi:hypothetical protein